MSNGYPPPGPPFGPLGGRRQPRLPWGLEDMEPQERMLYLMSQMGAVSSASPYPTPPQPPWAASPFYPMKQSPQDVLYGREIQAQRPPMPPRMPQGMGQMGQRPRMPAPPTGMGRPPGMAMPPRPGVGDASELLKEIVDGINMWRESWGKVQKFATQQPRKPIDTDAMRNQANQIFQLILKMIQAPFTEWGRRE